MRRHFAQDPFRERLAADEDDLLSSGIVTQRVEHAPEPAFLLVRLDYSRLDAAAPFHKPREVARLEGE